MIEFNYPLSQEDREKLISFKDPLVEGPTSIIVTGQDPTLAEMMNDILWASENLEPSQMMFQIDPTYLGEEEYLSIFQYLTSRGFQVKNGAVKSIVAVEPFDESTVKSLPHASELYGRPIPDEYGEAHADSKYGDTDEGYSTQYAGLPGLEPISTGYINNTPNWTAIAIAAGSLLLAITIAAKGN